MAINVEKGGKVVTLGGQDPKVKIPTTPQRGRKLYASIVRSIDLDNLEESRGKFVLQYQANPKPWPDGIGAWFRDEDWDDDGRLIVDGEAKARAIDSWANDRAKGRQCPPLPKVDGFKSVTKPTTVTKPLHDGVTKPIGGRPPKSGRAMTGAERAKELRAARKLGLTISEYRAQKSDDRSG